MSAAPSSSATAPSNLITITSPEHFTSVMQADLDKVSVLNFWAPWAEPCEQMNQVVRELAVKWPNVSFLEVEAEALPDVSESFDIESVPAFVLLRGHTLLGRITGANASALSSAVATHASSNASGGAPSSSSTAAPQAAPSTYAAGGAAVSGVADGTIEEHVIPASETPEELEQRCKDLMNSSKVVLFMKGNPDQPRCGFSQKTVGLLRENKVAFKSFDILRDEAVRQGLKKVNDWPTFPQLVIGGEFVGGLDILKELIETGELKDLLEQATAAAAKA